ncbi:MAG: YopX family protein [Fusobacteriaceae bacterium]
MKHEFRAWDKVDEIMLDHFQLLAMQTQRAMKSKNKIYDIFDDREWELQASLGIEDSQGVMVFEGDILETVVSKLDSYAYVVIRHPQTAGYVCKPFRVGNYSKKEPRIYSVALPTIDMLRVYKPVIIGNIFENKDLLMKEGN